MKNTQKGKFIYWLIVVLIIANIGTLVFYWVGHFKMQNDNAPKEFLARKLNFTGHQKQLYFDLAMEHNQNARKIRAQIKADKDAFFKLLQSDTIIDSARDNAALHISLSLQALDILTFEHFKKVRALCTQAQKPKFDALLQKMVNSVNNPQQGPPAPIK